MTPRTAPASNHYLRQDGHTWLYTEVTGMASTASFAAVGCTVSLAEIYEKVAVA